MKKMMKILGATLMITLLTSCFDDPGTDELLDPSVMEVELAAGSAASSTFTYLRENIGASLDAGWDVYLTSTSSPGLDVTFEIDPSSTAIEGVHYTLGGNSVNIPAGEFVGSLPVSILPDNIEAGEVWTVLINITGAGSANISPNYGSATHSIQISCPPNVGIGTYTTVATGIPDPDGCSTGFAYDGASVTVSYDAGRGIYTVSDADIGYFAGDYEAAADFENICDALTVSPNGGAPYGIAFTGQGIFIPDGGANGTGQIVFQCYYDAAFAGPGATETVAYDAAADVVFPDENGVYPE